MLDIICGSEEEPGKKPFFDVSHTKKYEKPTRSQVLIAEALKQMSIEDRERVCYEQHGVAEPIHETPEFVASKLNDFEEEMINLKTKSSLPSAAINLAESRDPQFIRNPKLRLKFLRACHFDCTKAASQMIRLFDWKLYLFGERKLCKDITFEDLEPEEVKVLKKGHVQVLPQRDRAGRAVVCLILNGQKYKTMKMMSRLWFYICKTDEVSDRKGVVFVGFKIAGAVVDECSAMEGMKFHRSWLDVPVNIVAIHKCLTSSRSNANKIMDLFMNMTSRESRAKVKIHYGSHTEWMYELMTYGIPHHLLPFTADFKIKTKNHLELLKTRKAGEEYAGDGIVETIELPTNSDVLLGRGKPIQDCAGNMRLQAIADDYVEQYHTSNKSEKTALAARLVRMTIETGGRFLTKESGIWIEVGGDIARDKVSHMFRHRRNLTIQHCMGKEGGKSHSTVRGHVATSLIMDLEHSNLKKRIKV